MTNNPALLFILAFMLKTVFSLIEPPHQMGGKVDDAVLKFSASYSYTSSPIYLQRQNSTSSSLQEFFRSEEHRNCLLVGSGNMKVKKTSKMTKVRRSVFETRWNEEVSYFQTSGIERSDEDVQMLELLVETPFLIFIINAVALFGVKVVLGGEKEEHSTEYQFLLLAEDFEASGESPPLVWIFNQLTGKGDQKILSPKILLHEPHRIHTYLRVWASDFKSMEGDKDRIVFKAKCKAEISFEFASILLQILPAAKEFIEKEGNKALACSMERDIVPGVDGFREAFIKWQRQY